MYYSNNDCHMLILCNLCTDIIIITIFMKLNWSNQDTDLAESLCESQSLNAGLAICIIARWSD